MKNNWQLQRDTENKELTFEDYDDYGFGPDHPVSIGDEVEAERKDDVQFGVVVGIIRDYLGGAVCYKVWSSDKEGGGQFDYIEASKVTLCEPCGSSKWSLERIGYKYLPDDSGGWYFYNEQSGDAIYRW